MSFLALSQSVSIHARMVGGDLLSFPFHRVPWNYRPLLLRMLFWKRELRYLFQGSYIYRMISMLIAFRLLFLRPCYTHRNFVSASNLLWGLGQPNSDLVRLTKILVELTLIFGYTNQKMMRVKATKFLVSTTKILIGTTKFFCSLTNFFVNTTKFDSADEKNLVTLTKVLVVLTKNLVASTLIIFWLV